MDERFASHQAVYLRKPRLRELFQDIHRTLRRLDDQWFQLTPGTRIELGSGVAPMRETFPDTLATDIVPDARLDAVLDAQELDLPKGSVRTLYLQNCFHHIPDPLAFFVSAREVLAPGGGIVMLEPHWGPLASAVYPRLFAQEGFDKNQVEWRTPMDGPMAGANQALSYVVLERDRREFERRFPELEVVDRGVLPSYMRYVLTGGLNFTQLAPNFLFPAIKQLERALAPLSPIIGLHQWHVIRRV